MDNMIKFYRGLVNNLPAAGTNGALYITTDEGAIYYGTGTGMKRLGDFVQVANVASLPEKAHESCLYYCVAENILAKWNGTEWKQINKQPTAEELKGLLGLGSMAYKSEVAEGDLNADLKAKVNAAAEGNHSHSNKTVLDGITAEKVSAWDAAEGNAKTYADGLNTAMNTRVEALEAIDHEHANKALLDTYTQTEANLADAVAKKHSHANAGELAKIADGDKAKWDAVAADYLTSADKTTLENSIKEAKKAGTDANTALETYKVSNDARVKAVEDDVAEITDGTNGILAQAKAYADGKDTAIAAAKKAGDDAQSDINAYKESNDSALAGVKATADAAAVKTEVNAELAKKVDKVEGKSLVSDSEITKLAGVSAGANKVESSANNGSIKIDGVETVVYTHPDKHAIADVDGLQAALDGKQAAGDYAAEVHTHTVADITNFDASVKAYDYATKAEAQGYANAKDEAIAAAQKAGDDAQDAVDALEAYVGTIPTSYTETNVIAYINKKAEETLSAAQGGSSETAASVKQQLDNYKSENDTRVKTAEDAIDAIEADYLKAADKTELSNAIAAEKERAEGIEGGLRTDVDAIKGDYLKASDKTDLQNQINLIMNNPDTKDVIDSISEFTQYIEDHGEIAEGFRTDIDQNKADIAAINNADTGVLAQAKGYADGLNTAMDTRVKVLEGIDHDAYVAADTALKAEIVGKSGDVDTVMTNPTLVGVREFAESQANSAVDAANSHADGAVMELKNGQVKANTEAIATKANSADVYTKTETYTKSEVEALLSWGSF